MWQTRRRERASRRRHAELALRHLGFYIAGNTDPSAMHEFRNALGRFQTAFHTKRTGRLDDVTFESLVRAYEIDTQGEANPLH